MAVEPKLSDQEIASLNAMIESARKGAIITTTGMF